MSNEYRTLKKQQYLAFIQECARSGQSKRQWCKDKGINYSSFMRWQARLRDELAGQIMEEQAIVPVKIAAPIPIDVPAQTMPLSEIRLQKDKLVIQLPSSLPAEYILAIAKGLV